MEPRIDGSRLAAQELCRFFKTHLVHQAELDNGAMLDAQLAHGLVDGVPQLGALQPRADDGRDLALGHHRLIFIVRHRREKREPTVGALPLADRVERLVDGDAIKPGAELGLALEAADVAMGLDKRFLDDVVGQRRVVQDALDTAPETGVLLPVEFTPGRFVARAEALQKIGRGVHPMLFTARRGKNPAESLGGGLSPRDF